MSPGIFSSYGTCQAFETTGLRPHSRLESTGGALEHTADHNRPDSQLKGEVETAQQQVRKLEAERVALVDRNAAVQTELDQLKAERRDATAAVAATQVNNQRLAEEEIG